MSPFKIERAASDAASGTELKKEFTSRDAKNKPVADRELTDVELASVSAAGNAEPYRSKV